MESLQKKMTYENLISREGTVVHDFHNVDLHSRHLSHVKVHTATAISFRLFRQRVLIGSRWTSSASMNWMSLLFSHD
jgi:hypothetical protein